MGRVSYYEQKVKPYLDLIKMWRRDGLNNLEIADKLNIKKTTLYKYQNKYIELKNALFKDGEHIDATVENTVLENAMGYDYEEEQVYNKKTIQYDDNGKKINEITEPQIIKVKKHKTSDQAAATWWLKNRKPGKWKDKQELDIGNSDGRPFKIEDVL